MFKFVSINEINMLELYLNSRPRQENSFNAKLIRFQITLREPHLHIPIHYVCLGIYITYVWRFYFYEYCWQCSIIVHFDTT